MEVIDTVKFVVPEWAVSWIINADASGLTDEEFEAVCFFESEGSTVCEQFGGKTFHWAMPEGEADFRHTNDVTGEAGNCYDIDLIIMGEK